MDDRASTLIQMMTTENKLTSKLVSCRMTNMAKVMMKELWVDKIFDF